jgi:predicted membrane-bound mannosyltransferase
MDAGSHRPTDRGRVVAVALAVYGVAWLLRFLYVVHLRASPLFDAPMLDELYHVEWARGLAAGDWVGSAAYFRAPFYPYLLGAAFALLRGSLFAARIVQVTYGALTPVVVLLIGRPSTRSSSTSTTSFS